ncbi:MAG UNVERIFIED_CONTAM: acyltransferase domain-containing protein [Microcystis novacekii LVE1205-3]|jgi:microcystin synthetase protein McyG
MAHQLYQTQPTFRKTLDAGENYYQKLTGKSLLNVLFAPTDDLLNQTAYTQPALFLIEVALVSIMAFLGNSTSRYFRPVV